MGHPAPRPAVPVSPPPEPASSSGLRIKQLGVGAPRAVGRYLLLDEIGNGGMATVHLARADGPGGFQRWFAVKRIHPHFAADEQFVDMFLDEARTAARISHPNVVQVFEIGKDDETYWLAMEYLHGDPLHLLLRRASERGLRVPPPIAARICADAADGLHAAHELCGSDGTPLGLVHRDVSPHNLFVTDDGRTKIVDFGIAKTIERLAQQTSAGVLKGKIAYMSPEQVKGEVIDRRTDVFALGVVLWEMTTGRRLFRADTDFETLTRLLDCTVPPPSSIVPGYPPALEACVLRALARRREDRFATARDLSRALYGYLVRSGAFAGVEEVASLVRALAADRIAQRDARLAAAADPPAPAPALAPVAEEPDDEALTVVAIRPPLVDLNKTVALPVSFGPAPSPAFTAPPAIVPASPYRTAPLALAPSPPAAPRRRAALFAGLALIAALSALAWLLLAR